MKTSLLLGLLGLSAASVLADPIQVSVRCTGLPKQEAAGAIIGIPAAKPAKGEPFAQMVVNFRSGNRVVLEMIREFRYPRALEFPKVAGEPITPTEFVTKNTGVTVTIEATQEGDQVFFKGACEIRRPATNGIASGKTPKDQPTVTSMTFITRECEFAGRAPLGVPAKIDISEKDVDKAQLTLTFTDGQEEKAR